MNSDFSDLLKLMDQFQVRFLVVGGYAVIRHTEPRFTKDLDLWIEATAENADRCFRALAAFGAPLAGLGPLDFTQQGYIYQMGVPPFRVDVLMSLSGLEFAEAWQRRDVQDIDGLSIPFLSRMDLIESKLRAGRPQDLLDVERLRQFIVS
jgi:hypothetical protein